MKRPENRMIWIWLAAVLLAAYPGSAQMLSGSAYLKTLPGARAQSMGSAYTAVIDDAHAMFANPAATGFFHEWQWSASYTQWFADVSNASVLYGRRLRMPWSRTFRIGAGVLYQGVPEFNSTNDATQSASASDVIVALGIGQPLSFLSDRISLGANFKYFDSNLYDYSDAAFVWDVGMMAALKPVALTENLDLVLTAGAAFNQNGRELTFVQHGTPLPQTSRFGVGAYLGNHFGNRLLVSLDHVRILDRDSFFTLGLEAQLFRFLALNAGWDFGIDLMNRMTMGASFQLEDAAIQLANIWPGRNQLARLDISSIDDQQFVSRTYRGSFSYRHNHPESFRFLNLFAGDSVHTSQVTLKWEPTQDRDVFDATRFRILVDQDSAKIERLVQSYKNADPDFVSFVYDSSYTYVAEQKETELVVDQLRGGFYHWVVLALDKDDHVRFARRGPQKIADFYVPLPDIEVGNFEFDYYPIITQDDYHGVFRVDVSNKGDRDAVNVIFKIHDEISRLEHDLGFGRHSEWDVQNFDTLRVGETRRLEFEWRTPKLGEHRLTFSADTDIDIQEWNDDNNVLTETLYTVPKGYIATSDTAQIHLTSRVSIELPIITEVNFDINSTEVPYLYLHETNMEPHLGVLAERLVEHPSLGIQLEGFADTNSGETDVALADARARAVRDSLLALGAKPDQIELLPGNVLPRRYIPANELFTKWVMQERRYVKIYAKVRAQDRLFAPILHQDIERFRLNVPFDHKIRTALPMRQPSLIIQNRSIVDTTVMGDAQTIIVDTLQWRARHEDLWRWNRKNADYVFQVRDDLGRQFSTDTSIVYLNDEYIERENRRAIPVQFAKTDPTYDVFWEKFYIQAMVSFSNPAMRLRFEGHACAIDPIGINQELSDRRSNAFFEGFVKYLNSYHPGDMPLILSRTDEPKGFGDTKPLGIQRLDGSQIILGDNTIPLGRKLNRRIEAVFYKKVN